MPGPTRVLIVDPRAESLDALVAGWGCEVEYARSGGGALVSFARLPHPDVAIIDVALPDLDGCDVIRTMKAAAPETFIIANTSHNELRAAAWAAGADAFLLKPDLQSLDDLLAQLNAVPADRKRRDA